MAIDCQSLIEGLVNNTKGITCKPVNNGHLLILPYFTPSNDGVQIWIKQENGNIIISDLGQSLEELKLYGYKVGGLKRRESFMENLSSHHMILDNEFLNMEISDLAQLPNAIQEFIQVILNIQGLHTIGRWETKKTFKSEIHTYLAKKRIVFDVDRRFDGITGRKYHADFAIVTANTPNDELVAAIDHTSKQRINTVFTMWSDCDYNNISILNDHEFEWPESDLKLLRQVSNVFLWENNRELLNEYIDNVAIPVN